MVEPKIVEINPVEVLYINQKGGDITSANVAWSNMVEFLLEKNLLKDAICRYGIVHTDSATSENFTASYDACVEFKSIPSPNAGVAKKTIPGGIYACFTHIGDYQEIENTFHMIRNWISENGVNLGALPHFQKYLDFDIFGKEPKDLTTEIYVPIL